MAIVLKPQEKLTGIKKEYHVRKHHGRNVVYAILDRQKEYCLLGQKIASITDYINNNIITDEPCFKVSTPGLYLMLDTNGPANSGYHKMRWKIMSFDIDKGAEVLEEVRNEYSNVVLVGDSKCYETS